MALDQAANFVREQVTSAISAGDTTINVADASPFPVPPEGYNIVVWDGAAYVRPDQDPDVEIMRVTDTDTTNDTLTVARGEEGTSDFSHPDTSVVVVAQTAKMIADIASEKISNPVTETVDANGNDVTNVGAAEVETLTSDRHFAGAFSGGDPDARLDTAIGEADGGDTIQLENATYSADRTIDSGRYLFVGTEGFTVSGTIINATWTFDNRCHIKQIRLAGQLTLNTFNGSVKEIAGGDIVVNDSNNAIETIRDVSVTLASGTSGNIVDVAIGSSITDNGSNVIGDTA